jgi:hypothetical protein
VVAPQRQPIGAHAQLAAHAPIRSWQQLLDDHDACVKANAPETAATAHGALHADHDMPLSVQRHIAPRVERGRPDWRILREQQDAAGALRELGFSVFHGGVCHSVIEATGAYELHQL